MWLGSFFQPLQTNDKHFTISRCHKLLPPSSHSHYDKRQVMKIFISIALVLTLLAATSTTTTAVPALEPATADVVGGLVQTLTSSAVPLGTLSGAVAPVAESSSLLEKRCPSCRLALQRQHHRDRHSSHHKQAHHGSSHSRYRHHVEAMINTLVNANTEIIAKALLKL